MNQMNVQEMTDRLKRLYPRISTTTKQNWDKAVRSINHLNVQDVTDDVALQYLECRTDEWSESTVKSRISALKGIWNKARKKKLYKADNPWLDLDDGLEIARRNPELYPWEFYEYYHEDPYFVCMWYTGLRISEIAGIYPENIHLGTGIPYFDIKRQPNRLLKNPCSIRQVPIHPACEPYVERLFFSKAKRPGASWSYNFGKNLGLPAGDAAHSLRHSLTTRMNDAEIIDRVQDAILGHGAKSMTAKYGKVTLETKYQAIKKLR